MLTLEELQIQHQLLSELDWIEYARNQREIRKLSTEWKDTRHQVDKQNRRAKRLGESGRVSVMEWEVCLAKAGYRCLGCGETDWLVMDHIQALSMLGEHTKDNVQPLCRWCNNEKGTKTIDYRIGKGAARREYKKPEVTMQVASRHAEPEVIMDVRKIPSPPPTQLGEHTWWKCARCKRYYNAPTKLSMCVLCQHNSLRVGG